jgi:hypothetical protein
VKETDHQRKEGKKKKKGKKERRNKEGGKEVKVLRQRKDDQPGVERRKEGRKVEGTKGLNEGGGSRAKRNFVFFQCCYFPSCLAFIPTSPLHTTICHHYQNLGWVIR